MLHHGPDNAAVRIRQQHPVTQFTDQLRGIIHADEKLAREDFIIHRRDGLFAYNPLLWLMIISVALQK